MYSRTRTLLAVALVSLSGCASRLTLETAEILPEIRPHPLYEEFFPYYAELCAVSQFRSFEYGQGGIPGHAVMYLKGACKDENAPYPMLRECRGVATTRDGPEHGAGISVNRWFLNVNWVAIPGKKLFFDGNLDNGELLDQAAFDRALQASLDAGIFDGVELDPAYPTTDGNRSLEKFIAQHSLATDFALRFSRTSFCARMPVTEEMMGEIIDYMNALNEEYASGVADYNWSGYSDNCVHLLRNALAAASIWRPRSVQATHIRQFFNVAVPANEFVNLAYLGAHGPLADGRQVYRDDEARDALLDFDWLPRRHGALVKVLPVHENNALYDTTARIFILENPFTLGVRGKATRLINDPRFTDLRTNLEHFREVYEEILEERDETIAGGFLPLRSVRYLRVTKRYFEYLDEQLAEVNRVLARMDAAEASAP